MKTLLIPALAAATLVLTGCRGSYRSGYYDDGPYRPTGVVVLGGGGYHRGYHRDYDERHTDVNVRRTNVTVNKTNKTVNKKTVVNQQNNQAKVVNKKGKKKVVKHLP